MAYSVPTFLTLESGLGVGLWPAALTKIPLGRRLPVRTGRIVGISVRLRHIAMASSFAFKPRQMTSDDLTKMLRKDRSVTNKHCLQVAL